MHLIVPAAGQSSRFPNVRPKWMLTHPNGNLMLAEAVRGEEIDGVIVGLLAAHVERYQCLDGVVRQFRRLGLDDKLKIVVLDKPTQSQPETVAKAIEMERLRGPICIKDSDNYFRLRLLPRNFVSVVDLNSVGLINPSNKSYVMVNDNNLVTNIVEKRAISNLFCSGAYGFEDAEQFRDYYLRLREHASLYISHLIYQMILDEKAFSTAICSDYVDWGTLKDWNRYKSKYATLFVDFDGTLVCSSGEFFHPQWGETEGIAENIRALNRLYDTGKVQIILTTCRPEEAREITLAQIEKEGIKYHQILFGLHHAKRIVINDYAPSNPFRSCDAINLPRNSDQLGDLIEAMLPSEGD